MRWKIVVVNAGILVIVALLSYVLLVTALSDVLSNSGARKSEVERAIRSANAQLSLDGLEIERWLSQQVVSEQIRELFSSGTASARSEGATAQANRIRDAAVGDPMFAKMAPTLVAFIDRQGVVLGRNGSNLMRGDRLGEVYPSVMKSMEAGQTASAVWLNRQRQEQMFASYAPVRNDDGQVVGSLVVGTPLNDERLSRTSDLTSGRALVIGVKAGAGPLELVANGGGVPAALLAALGQNRVKDIAGATLQTRKFAVIEGATDTYVLGAAPLSGYGGAQETVILAGVPASLVSSTMSVLWPIFAVTALGLVLILLGGIQLGNYISQPISELEEGLLTVINGKTDHRFQIEHPDLGGLVFRINSLLNAVMGVPETDDEGRTSEAPQPYQDGTP